MKKIFIIIPYLLISIISGIKFVSAQSPTCKANFFIIPDSSVSSSQYVYYFVDNSVGNNIVSRTWDFGDGTPVSNEINTVHIYKEPGIYNVCLTIKTKNGGVIDCENKSCKEINVKKIEINCFASFYYYNYGSNSGDTIGNYPPANSNTYYFANNSVGKIKKWYWDFGDGSKDTLPNPVHTFTPGMYNVCLTIEGLLGDGITLCQDTYCEQILVSQTSFCYADFYAYADSANNLSYQFADLSTGLPNKYYWNFGDFNSSDNYSSLNNPVHTFSKPGEYNVCLTIINDTLGCKDMKCYKYFVGVEPNTCKAAFLFYPDTIKPGHYVFNFVNISKGNPEHFLWSFGDGSVSQLESPSYTYKDPGMKNVCFKIFSDNGNCNDTYCQTVFIGEKPSDCKSYFTAYLDGSVNTPNLYRFDNKSTGNYTKWYWQFDDGTVDSTTANPSHQYLQPGIYYPCLVIKNPQTDCKDIYCMKIFIGGPFDSCHAEFDFFRDASVVSMPYSDTYYFTDLSEGNIGNWFWDFGDGNFSKEQNPVHNFYPGTYKVCLTISELGDFAQPCSDTFCKIIVVDSLITPPLDNCNNYYLHAYDKNDSLLIHFYGNSYYSQMPVNYFWDFGDGQYAQSQNTSHRFSAPGVYQVSLTTIGADSCKFTTAKTIFAGIQTGKGSIEGQVFAGGVNADKAIVIISSWESNANYFTYFDTTHVDSIGGYHFRNIPYGRYYVMTILTAESQFAKNFLPTYYTDSWTWKKATLIEVGEIMPTVQYDIHMVSCTKPTNGPGIIQGYVTYGGVNPPKKDPGLSGIEVILFDINDKPLDVTFTDAKGYFLFKNLPYGTYKVYVEIMGIYSTAALVTISENNQVIENIGFNVDAKILPFIINVSNDDIDNRISARISDIYPNPVSSQAKINIFLNKATNITLSTYNHIGQILYSTDYSLTKGSHILTFSTSHLPKGIFYMNIKSADGINTTKKFIKL